MYPSAKHVAVLREALGMRTPTSKPFRNAFVANESHDAMLLLNELLVAGFMDVTDNPGGSGHLFKVTEQGRRVAVGLESPLEVALSDDHKAAAQRVAGFMWRAAGAAGRPEQDGEPTSVGKSWYDDRALEVVTGLVALGYAIKAPEPKPVARPRP